LSENPEEINSDLQSIKILEITDIFKNDFFKVYEIVIPWVLRAQQLEEFILTFKSIFSLDMMKLMISMAEELKQSKTKLSYKGINYFGHNYGVQNSPKILVWMDGEEKVIQADKLEISVRVETNILIKNDQIIVFHTNNEDDDNKNCIKTINMTNIRIAEEDDSTEFIKFVKYQISNSESKDIKLENCIVIRNNQYSYMEFNNTFNILNPKGCSTAKIIKKFIKDEKLESEEYKSFVSKLSKDTKILLELDFFSLHLIIKDSVFDTKSTLKIVELWNLKSLYFKGILYHKEIILNMKMKEILAKSLLNTKLESLKISHENEYFRGLDIGRKETIAHIFTYPGLKPENYIMRAWTGINLLYSS